MGRRGRRENGMSAAPPATSPPGSRTGATAPPCAATTACLATCADLPTTRERAPGTCPEPLVAWERVVLVGGHLAIDHRRRGPGSSRPPRYRRRLRSLGLRRVGDLGGRGARLARLGSLRRGLAGLRIASQAGRVLVPVGLAHPPQTVLLAGLLREVLNRGVVGFDPEPRRADALSRVRHVRRPFACQPRSGVGAHIHHSSRETMQGRRSGLAR